MQISNGKLASSSDSNIEKYYKIKCIHKLNGKWNICVCGLKTYALDLLGLLICQRIFNYKSCVDTKRKKNHMVICAMQTMLKTTFAWIAMQADGGTRYIGLIWGLGYATGASLPYLTVTFSAIGNSATLGWSKVLAIKVLVDCQLITTALKHSYGKRILQDSRSFKLELWRNIFMEKFGKTQWPLNFLSKYHDWNHTNPPRGKPGNGRALWPRGVLIAPADHSTTPREWWQVPRFLNCV